MTPVAIGAAKDEPPFTPVAPAREVKTGTFCPNAQKSFAQLSLSPADWNERVTPPTLITPSMSCGKESVSFGAKELTTYCKEAGFSSLELREEHVFALETLARPGDAPKHNDPFGRALVAQAKMENMTFLTHDSLIPYYKENCIVWV